MLLQRENTDVNVFKAKQSKTGRLSVSDLGTNGIDSGDDDNYDSDRDGNDNDDNDGSDDDNHDCGIFTSWEMFMWWNNSSALSPF